jgi:predicted flap endonuclease-1-like 5' DNA nuclease
MNQLILFDFANGAFTQHALEILAMLLGSFAIGVWLGWAVWARYKFQIDQKDLDNQSHLATVNALREEIRTVREKIAASDAECASLNEKNAILTRDNRMLDQERQSLENKLADLYAEKRKVDTELALSHTVALASGPGSVALELPDSFQEQGVVPPETAGTTTASATDNTGNAEEVQEMPLPHLDNEPQQTRQVVFLEETDNDSSADAPAEQPSSVFAAPADAAEPVPVTAHAPDVHDDLTVIEGIGTKIQMLLNQYGIYTYQHLSETEVARLSEILAKAGPQLAMHNPGTWPSQAKLAADGQWDTLTAIQGFLKGGKKPTL